MVMINTGLFFFLKSGDLFLNWDFPFFLVRQVVYFCGNKQRVEFGNAKEIWKIYETC